jgi:hypothetical protein
MYDGSDVALVLGGLTSAGLAGLSLIAAVASLGYYLAHKSRNETAGPSSGRLAVLFAIVAVLCATSAGTRMAVYSLFDHRRGYTNPPAHVLAVAVASLWGPVAAGLVAFFWPRGKKRAPGGESSRAEPGGARAE